MFGKMKLENLRTLYLDELKDAYDFEHQLLDALPKMEKAATADELKAAFRDHRGADRAAGHPARAGVPEPGGEAGSQDLQGDEGRSLAKARSTSRPRAIATPSTLR